MSGQDPRVLDLGVVVRLIEYEVVPDPSLVDLVEGLKVPAGVAQLLEVLAAFGTGEHVFGDAVSHHKVDGTKSTGGVGEYGGEILTKEAINGDLCRMKSK